MHSKQSPSEGAARPGGELIKHLRLDVHADLSVGKLIGVVIVVIIGLLLLPIVQDSVTDAKNSTDSTGDTLLDMVPNPQRPTLWGGDSSMSWELCWPAFSGS